MSAPTSLLTSPKLLACAVSTRPVAGITGIDPIAGGSGPAYADSMMKVSVLCAAIALCACDRSPDVSAPKAAEHEPRPAHLPFDKSTGFLNGYSLSVTRAGNLLWNGTSVTDSTLNDYLSQFSALPRDAEGLFVAFEPGVSAARANRVRRQVAASGLCPQRRCWEVG